MAAAVAGREVGGGIVSVGVGGGIRKVEDGIVFVGVEDVRRRVEVGIGFEVVGDAIVSVVEEGEIVLG